MSITIYTVNLPCFQAFLQTTRTSCDSLAAPKPIVCETFHIPNPAFMFWENPTAIKTARPKKVSRSLAAYWRRTITVLLYAVCPYIITLYFIIFIRKFAIYDCF
jgi:hypothetical protein